jgi:hypothetical protein
MSTIDIRKIYANPELLETYRALELEIRSLDAAIPIPPPVHVAALTEMRGILAALQGQTAE